VWLEQRGMEFVQINCLSMLMVSNRRDLDHQVLGREWRLCE
jgi:hypothetical protein